MMTDLWHLFIRRVIFLFKHFACAASRPEANGDGGRRGGAQKGLEETDDGVNDLQHFTLL